MEGIYLRSETIEPSQTRTHHEFFERVKAVSLSMLQILLIELMVFLFAAILCFIKPTHLCWRRGLSRRFYKHKDAILPARRGISLKTKTLEPSQVCTRDEFLKCEKAATLSRLQILLIDLMVFYLPLVILCLLKPIHIRLRKGLSRHPYKHEESTRSLHEGKLR